ncbi:hypothetical protein AAI421_13410 [Rhodococcus aetherivorans]|uniref:hypothetical protein n=1 Tax=Rhodococcus aetherivorans TaxID=191292 RepID=UPI0031E383F6
MISVRFTRDRGPRQSGDVVAYDEVSAAAIVREGAAVYVDEPDSGVVERQAEPVDEPVDEPEKRRARRAAKPDESGD